MWTINQIQITVSLADVLFRRESRTTVKSEVWIRKRGKYVGMYQ